MICVFFVFTAIDTGYEREFISRNNFHAVRLTPEEQQLIVFNVTNAGELTGSTVSICPLCVSMSLGHWKSKPLLTTFRDCLTVYMQSH